MKFTFKPVIVGDELSERTIFFDSTCNLCLGSVDFIRRNQRNTFVFVPLSVSEFRDEVASSIIYKENGKYYRRSDAALKIVHHLRWPFSWMYFLIVIPRFLRNWIYNIVARNRYRWFGRCETCRVGS